MDPDFVHVWTKNVSLLTMVKSLPTGCEYVSVPIVRAETHIQLSVLRSSLFADGFRQLQFLIVNAKQTPPGGNGSADPNVLYGLKRIRELAGTIPVVQDDDNLQLLDTYEASTNDVLIMDRCARLTYHIVQPWSLLQYPYVRAAILSTFHDDPCGQCGIPYDTPIDNQLDVNNLGEESSNEHSVEDGDNKNTKDSRNATKDNIMAENMDNAMNQTPSETNANDNPQTPENNSELSSTSTSAETVATTQKTNGNQLDLTRTSGMNHAKINLNPKNNTTSASGEIQEAKKVNRNDNADNAVSSEQSSMEVSGMHESTTKIQTTKHDSVESNHFNSDVKSDSKQTSSEKQYINKQRRHSKHRTSKHTMTDDGNNKVRADSIALNNNDNKPKSAPRTSEEFDYRQPIRIVLHSPRVHTYGYTVRKHEYVVLETGLPYTKGNSKLEPIITEAFTEHKHKSHDRSIEELLEAKHKSKRKNVDDNKRIKQKHRSGNTKTEKQNEHAHKSRDDSNNGINSNISKPTAIRFKYFNEIYTDENGVKFMKIHGNKYKDNNGTIIESIEEIVSVKETEFSEEETDHIHHPKIQNRNKIDALKNQFFEHYDKLLPWLHHIRKQNQTEKKVHS